MRGFPSRDADSSTPFGSRCRPAVAVVLLLAGCLTGLNAVTATAGAAAPAAAPAPASTFTPATGRVLDTAVPGPLPAGRWTAVRPPAGLGIPAGVTALELTFTVPNQNDGGYVSAVAAGAAPSTATSVLNWNRHETISNSAVVATDPDGGFQVYASSTTGMLIDLEGYFTPATGTSAPGGFVPLPNGGRRIVDSRRAGAPKPPLVSGSTYAFTGVSAEDQIPSDATALYANLTVIPDASSPAALTVWPAGTPQPRTTLDFPAGRSTAVGTVIGLNSAGQFDLALQYGQVNLVVDVQGYYTSIPTRSTFTPVSARVYDSRLLHTSITPQSLTRIPVAALGGVPASRQGVADEVIDVSAVSTSPSSGGYLRLWGTNQAEPTTTSDLNFSGVQVRSNLVTVVPGTDNNIWLRYVGSGSAAIGVVVDVEGWSTTTSTAAVPGAPSSVTATAADGRATVSFQAPSDDGGAPVTSYTVEASPNGMTATALGSPVVVTGLHDGTSYTFTVTATNSAGTGPASTVSDPVTPEP